MIKGIPGSLTLEADIANTHPQHLRGLMGGKPRNLLFIFPKEQPICLHTVFVEFPITALLLDDTFKVIESTRLQPYQTHCFRNRSRYLLELAYEHDVEPGVKLEAVW